MNENPNAANDAGEREPAAGRKLRIVWSILTLIFVGVVLLHLHEWSQGTESWHEMLSPLGMVFLGAAILFGAKNKNLYRVLIGIALILVVTGLITLIIY